MYMFKNSANSDQNIIVLKPSMYLIFHFREADHSGIQQRKLAKFLDYNRPLYLKTVLNWPVLVEIFLERRNFHHCSFSGKLRKNLFWTNKKFVYLIS